MMLKKKTILFSSLYVSLLALLLSSCIAQTKVRNGTFQVGVILDLDSLVGRMGLTSLSLALSDFYSHNANYSTKLKLHVRDSKGQVVDAAVSALGLLKDEEVDVIIGPQKSTEVSFVVGLGDRANVPIISFSATSPSLHSRTPYFVQTALVDSAQVGAIAALVEHFHWSQVVLIYEESDYGNSISPYLSNAFKKFNAQISYKSVITIAASDEIMLNELFEMKTMQTRVFVVHMSSTLASRFFPKVKEAGMMSEGYAWIVTSGLMDLLYSLDSHVLESMQGVLGVKPVIPRTRKLTDTAKRWKRKFLHDNPEFSQTELGPYGVWAYDTLWALAMAAEKVQYKQLGSRGKSHVLNPTNLFSTEVSQTGPELLEAILGVTFEGLGGNFHLVNRQLEPSSFQILNVVGKGEREVGIWTTSQGILREGRDISSTSNIKTLKAVVFPGESAIVPKGWEVPVDGKKLRIGVTVAAGFPEMVRVEKDPQTNRSLISGCYIEYFDAVMSAMSYTVPYEYFPFEKPDGSPAGSYDEFTYQVFLQNYDVAVGDTTITSKRSKYADFTLPFNVGGVTLVVPNTRDNPNGWFFWEPFTKELWLSTLALFIFTGVALWVLERRFNKAYRGPTEKHIGMIFYFPFMSMVYAQKENIVTNLARVVVIVWVFVVLLLNSTYTASLSARLTVQGLRPVVTDVKELIRRGDYVGCQEGAFTCDFAIRLGIDNSKIRSYKNAEDVDEAFTKGSKNGGISAFLSTKPYTNLFLSKYCDKYTTIGPTHPTQGFAFVFAKGSPLVADVSRVVVQLTENGRISEIEGQWMKYHKCNGTDSTTTSTRVSLESFQILFGITGAITATCLLVSLSNYVHKNRDFLSSVWNSNTTLWLKFCAICDHFDQEDPKFFPSKGRKYGEAILTGNPCSATVVPISSIEITDVHVGSNLNSEYGDLAIETRPPANLGNKTVN